MLMHQPPQIALPSPTSPTAQCPMIVQLLVPKMAAIKRLSAAKKERRNSETRNVEEQIKRLSDLFNQNKRLSFKNSFDGDEKLLSDLDSSTENVDDGDENLLSDLDSSTENVDDHDMVMNESGDSEYFTADEASPTKPMSNGHDCLFNNFSEKSDNEPTSDCCKEESPVMVNGEKKPIQLDFKRSQVLLDQ